MRLHEEKTLRAPPAMTKWSLKAIRPTRVQGPPRAEVHPQSVSTRVFSRQAILSGWTMRGLSEEVTLDIRPLQSSQLLYCLEVGLRDGYMVTLIQFCTTCCYVTDDYLGSSNDYLKKNENTLMSTARMLAQVAEELQIDLPLKSCGTSSGR